MAETERQSVGKEKAVELAESHWWELCDHREIAEFQLFTVELCCPFPVFHEAVEKSLGRPVFSHEFGLDYDGIVKEFLGEREAPTLSEVLDLIPEEKRFIVTPLQPGDNDPE